MSTKPPYDEKVRQALMAYPLTDEMAALLEDPGYDAGDTLAVFLSRELQGRDIDAEEAISLLERAIEDIDCVRIRLIELTS